MQHGHGACAPALWHQIAVEPDPPTPRQLPAPPLQTARVGRRETRSLKACYELLKAGWKDVLHMKGGLSTWRYDGYPTESGA